MSIKLKLTEEQKKLLQSKFPQASFTSAATLQPAANDEWLVNGITPEQINAILTPKVEKKDVPDPAIEKNLQDMSLALSSLIAIIEMKVQKTLAGFATLDDLKTKQNEAQIAIKAVQETIAQELKRLNDSMASIKTNISELSAAIKKFKEENDFGEAKGKIVSERLAEIAKIITSADPAVIAQAQKK